MLAPEKIAPLAVLLCHPACPVPDQTYQAGAGVFSRVTTQLTEGYALKDGESAEDLFAQLGVCRVGPTAKF